MSILLHACCADCTLKFIHSLPDKPDLYFYNPNIHPRSEYQARLLAIQKIAADSGCRLIIPDWQPADYFAVIKINTRPLRCPQCWQLRLSRTAEYAASHDYSAFSSTLLTSHYQDAAALLKLGSDIAASCHLQFFTPVHLDCDLPTAGFYKQFFCGCCYSPVERFQEKYIVLK